MKIFFTLARYNYSLTYLVNEKLKIDYTTSATVNMLPVTRMRSSR